MTERSDKTLGTTVRAGLVALLLALFALVAVGPAGAQTTYPPSTPTPSMTPSDEVSPKVAGASVEGGGTGSTEGSSDDGGVLAFTGADMTALLFALAGLLGLGTALLVTARRRVARQTS